MAAFTGMKVTVMGLGVNGGGLESARYLALNGAECTITDMKDEKALAPSLEKLQALSGPHLPFRFVLGRHEMEDFSRADIVVKNPAVRPDSQYLTASKRIETDISLFLAASPARLIAVTGSKGKSGTASAVHWVLSGAREVSSRKDDFPALNGKAFLGGNITVSPLSFLGELSEADDVVLELSSWQLGDLKGRLNSKGCFLLKPRAAILTSIMPDHQDRYSSMDAYVNDKRIIYQGQDKNDATIACADDHWGKSFLEETPGRPIPYSENPGNDAIAAPVPLQPLVPGRHSKKNLLAASSALMDLGLPASLVRESLGSFPGIEHRLEFFRETEGIRFYNDSAATIPEAAAAAIETFTGSSGQTEPYLILVTGGTDKNLDFNPLVKAIVSAGSTLEIVLLSGTGSEKLIAALQREGISFRGPFDNIDKAARTALELGLKAGQRTNRPTDTQITVVLSPGCTSFGMFNNEFDRGLQWKEAVHRL